MTVNGTVNETVNGTANETDVFWTAAESIPLGGFCFLATVASLSGNSLVLYSSFRHNAIKLDDGELIDLDKENQIFKEDKVCKIS